MPVACPALCERCDDSGFGSKDSFDVAFPSRWEADACPRFCVATEPADEHPRKCICGRIKDVGTGFGVCRFTEQRTLSAGHWPVRSAAARTPRVASAPGAHTCHRLLGSSLMRWEVFTDWCWKQYYQVLASEGLAFSWTQHPAERPAVCLAGARHTLTN